MRPVLGRPAFTALMCMLAGACGSDYWPREAVNLEVDLGPSIDGWIATNETDCVFNGDTVFFEPIVDGKNALDRGPEAADRERFQMDGTTGELVDDACRVAVRFDVVTDQPLVIEVSQGGDFIDSLETRAVIEEYNRSGIEWSPGSPWRLGG